MNELTLKENIDNLHDFLMVASKQDKRTIVAVAGPPGAGKSTFADMLLRDVGHSATIVRMDGFHLDNLVLRQLDIFDRKGAPETFDADGFLCAIKRISTEDRVVIPTFDRDADICRAGSAIVEPHHKVVVVEGNYLLLNSNPWRNLKQYWSKSVYLNVCMKELEARLVERWINFGLTRADALERAMANDLPNARLIAQETSPADFILDMASDGDDGRTLSNIN